MELTKTFWFRFDPKLRYRNIFAFVSIAGRAGSRSCSRLTDGQYRQGRRLIMQHAVRWTGKAGDVACIRPTDGQKRQGRR